MGRKNYLNYLDQVSIYQQVQFLFTEDSAFAVLNVWPTGRGHECDLGCLLKKMHISGILILGLLNQNL